MSELDADLYGDLYGDDNEFVVPTEESKETQRPETQPPPSAPANPVAPAAEEAKPIPTVSSPPATYAHEQYKAPPMNGAPSQAPSYSAQASQPYANQFSSYQTAPSTESYNSQYQNDYNTQPIASSLSIVDRSVRPSEMKEEGKMFIGGLNWDTTDENLKKYFEQFGRVEACTIMRDANGRSRCFAFLTFEEPASVNAVMVREHFLDGKIIDPKRAIPRQEHQRAQKLFIGGLAGSVTSESMREYFSQYGKVIDSTVMLDRETGRSKGFGFVSFEDANVDPILGFGKLEIDGKLIDVKLAQPRSARDGMMGGGRESGGYERFGGQGAPQGVPAGVPQAQGSTPFDPQALAALYTRMFQQFGGPGGMNTMGMGMGGGAGGMGGQMMAGGVPGMGAGGYGAQQSMGRMSPGMGGGAQGGMQGGQMAMGAGGGMGRGVPNAMSGGPGQMMGGPVNAPRGPRGGPGGPGPQRTGQRGNAYHPYAR